MPSIGIVTAASEQFWPLLKLTAPNKLEYALRQGYSVDIVRHLSDIRADRGLLMLRSLERFDWCWFMGADTVITNMTIDAAVFCDERTDVAMCRVWNRLNNDSMFLRSCPGVIKWLESTYLATDKNQSLMAMPDEVVQNDDNLQYLCGIRVTRLPQRAFNSWPEDMEFDTKEKGKTKLVPTGMPGYGPWQKGDFVAHFPSQSLEARLKVAKYFLKNVVR